MGPASNYIDNRSTFSTHQLHRLLRGEQRAKYVHIELPVELLGALLARQPETVLDHPRPKRLPTHLGAVLVEEDFGGECPPEVGIRGPDQLECTRPDTRVQAMVRRLTSTLVDQGSATILAIPDQKPVHLPYIKCQHRRRGHATSTRKHFRQNFHALHTIAASSVGAGSGRSDGQTLAAHAAGYEFRSSERSQHQ